MNGFKPVTLDARIASVGVADLFWRGCYRHLMDEDENFSS